eukprot:gene10691-biopygen1709
MNHLLRQMSLPNTTRRQATGEMAPLPRRPHTTLLSPQVGYVVSCLPADLDRRLLVESPPSLLAVRVIPDFDECIELFLVLQLRVTVQQQRRVINIRNLLLVERLKVPCQIMDALRVKELPDHVTGLKTPDSQNILVDSVFVVGFLVEPVTVFFVDVHDLLLIEFLCG